MGHAKTARAIILCLAISAILSGCGSVTKDVELPSNSGAGSDEMKASPCACSEIKYDGSGFEWRKV